MTNYFLARNDDKDVFAVFETNNGQVARCYPHTKDSATFNEIERLIEANSSQITYGTISQAEQLPWKPIAVEVLADRARQTRNELLKASDWTQVADAQVNKAAWADYRKALRDLPEQDGFPLDVVWPKQPAA